MQVKNHIKDPSLTEKIEKVIDYNRNDVLPIASVIIVTYNTNKKLLDQCLGSLREQTFKDFEFLIVNDGSTDRTAEILRSYDDPRIIKKTKSNIDNIIERRAKHE